MKNKNIVLMLMITFIAILLATSKVEAADLELKNLEYKVKLNSDGSANVTEIWNIYIENTNTLFKTFEIDKSKYKEITDVTVAEVVKGRKIQARKITQERYHVPKGYYYALVNQQRKFEIAWGAQVEDETKTYEISYKIVDAVKNYKDCSEFNWQFISTISEIPARRVYGTIQLPREVEDIEEFRVWAHGPLNGEIKKISKDTVVFEVEHLNAKTMLEARVVTPTEIFEKNQNKEDSTQLQSILKQEQQWADEANAQRERIAKRRKIMKIILIGVIIVMNVIGLFLAIYLVKKIKEYKKILEETPEVKPEQESKYFRDIPDETATPAEAAFLYYFNKGDRTNTEIAKIVSATMLDLCLKKYIEFEQIAGKKEQIKVVIKQEQNTELLQEDEKIVYDILTKIPKADDSFTMKEFQKYCNKNSISITSKFDAIGKKAKEKQEEKENYSKEIIEQAKSWGIKSGVGVVCAVFSVVLAMWLAVIPSILFSMYASKISARLSRLTQKGTNEKEQWEGLKRYMKDFSMIKDKTVPELILWEKYLMYATAFGMAETVLKQLKVVYPQITDTDYMTSHGYAYMYLMYSTNFNHSFINTLNNSVTTTYNNVTSRGGNYSSGFGGGGGFSGGGGFGGGGGRNGWQIGPIGTVLFGPI